MIQIGIIGLTQSGKTTIFNALAAAHAQIGGSAKSKRANVAVVKIPDDRLAPLAEMVGAARTVNVEVEFIDAAGLEKGKAKEKSGEADYMAALRQTAAVIIVIRCFKDADVPHPLGDIDPARDAAEVETELMLNDMILVENRLEKLRHLLKVKPSPEYQKEQQIMEKLKNHLEAGHPLRGLALAKEEQAQLAGFGFLSLKPALYLLNIGEDEIGAAGFMAAGIFPQLPDRCLAAAVCGKIEMELAELSESDRREFMKEIGIGEPALTGVISRSFELLDLICFLTANEKEARAWAVPRGTTAYAAAGMIHSDIQRGFIKAETISFSDLADGGSWAEARRHGKVRIEGKDYIVRDGDVIQFRFNV